MPGYLYLLPNAGAPDRVSALPSLCPACGDNYSSRKYRKSPVRGFRTGFSKLTQLLSKELFYLIPGDPPGSRKLVLFSDSREEAASLANGVERSHYLDLVREALYDELAKLAIGEPPPARRSRSARQARARSRQSRFAADLSPTQRRSLSQLIRAAHHPSAGPRRSAR